MQSAAVFCRYHIDRASDPDRLFDINRDGLVTLMGTLDREGELGPTLRVHVLAVDKGIATVTCTAAVP